MSEEKPIYKVNTEPGVIRASCFRAFNDDWTQPTPREVRDLINKLGMTGAEVANFVGAKSSRNIRKWQADDTQLEQSSAKISYSAWRLLAERYVRIETGKKKCVDLLADLKLSGVDYVVLSAD